MDELNSPLVDFFKDATSSDPLQLEELIKTGVNLNAPLSLEDGSRPLLVAATSRDVKMVETLLDHGGYVDVPDYFGNTPSHYAAREGHGDVLELLIERDANVNLQNDKECTVLDNAVLSEDLDITRLLLNKGASVVDAQSALFHAVKKENIQITKELLKVGVKMNRNVMEYAVNKGNTELVRILNGNVGNIWGENWIITMGSLEIAIKSGHYNMIEIFLKNGMTDDKLMMMESLSTALNTGQCEIAKLLCEKGAELPGNSVGYILKHNIENGNIDTVKFILEGLKVSTPVDTLQYMCCPNDGFNKILCSAVQLGNLEIIKLVLDRVTDVNVGDIDRKTSLIIATENGLIPVVKMLLEKGANARLSDRKGKTALYYALLHKEAFPIVEILFERGASVNDIICSKSYTTPLHVAARTKNASLIEFLLQKKPDVNAKDISGNTPLHVLFEEHLTVDADSLICCTKRLLEEGGNLDCLNDEEQTPVDKAVENCSTNILGTFLDAAFSVSRNQVLSSITPQVLCDMILNGHISLLRLVLNNVAEFFIEEILTISNIPPMEIRNGEVSKSLKQMEEQKEPNSTSLFQAAYSGDIRMAEAALQNGVDIDTRFENRISPLQIAIYKCNFEMAELLISKGASVIVEDGYHLLPFQLAVLLGHIGLVEQIHDKLCQNDVNTVYGISLLNLAVYHKNIDFVKFVLEKLSNINTIDANMDTVLHTAVTVQDIQLVNFCIEHGVDINAQNDLGDTALHTALYVLDESKSSDFEIAVCLLNKGVDINISNIEKKTVLHLAASHDLTPFIGIILEKGVKDINAKDIEGHTPLQQLILNMKDEQNIPPNATSLVTLFLKNGAAIDSNKDSDDLVTLFNGKMIEFDRFVAEFCRTWQPWMKEALIALMAKVSGTTQRYILKLVLDQRFSLNEKLPSGESIFDYIFEHCCTNIIVLILKNDKTLEIESRYLFRAIKKADLEIVKVLLDIIDVNITDSNKCSTLEYVTITGNRKRPKYGLAQLFLDRGVNVKNTDSRKRVPLVEVARDGNWSMVNILLDKGADINALDRKRESTLLVAIRQGKQCVRLLLERGAIATNIDSYLFCAAFRKNSKITDLLLTNGAKPNVCNNEGITPLHIAAKTGDYKTVKLLVNAGAELSPKDNQGNTPLHKTQSIKVAKLLIEKGASITAKNNQERSPLHQLFIASKSAAGNVKDITKLYIQSGAAVNEQDINGSSPLNLAVKNKNFDSVVVLIGSGAKLNLQDKQGWTPLHHAVRNNSLEIVEYLLGQGALPNVKNTKEETLVHLAAEQETSDSLLICIQNNLKLDMKDRKGWTPLYHAVHNNRPQNAELLLNHGVSFETKDSCGVPLLCLAAENETTDLLLVLIRHGAKLDTKDQIGRTPLYYAVEYNRVRNVDFLLNVGIALEVKNIHGIAPLQDAEHDELSNSALIFIKQKEMLDAEDSFGMTVLYHALQRDNTEMVQYLLHSGASPNLKNISGKTLYQLYARPFSTSKVKKCFTKYIQLGKLAGLPIHDNAFFKMEKTNEEKALQELNCMKNIELKDGFYLIDVFSNIDRPSYLFDEDKMEKLNTLFQAPEFRSKFPLYADILKSAIFQAKRSRHYLLRVAMRSMMSVNRKDCCQVTPYLVWEYVFGFLDLEDRANVIKSVR